jgi:hypothetical protein
VLVRSEIEYHGLELGIIRLKTERERLREKKEEEGGGGRRRRRRKEEKRKKREEKRRGEKR